MWDEYDSNRHEKRFGLIVDGVHTCPEAVKLAYRTSPKRLVTVWWCLMMWPSRVVILSSWLLTRIISHLWKKCLWFVWRWSISGSHVDFKVLVTDAIAGLGLEEGSTFKSGQQVAEACIHEKTCLLSHHTNMKMMKKVKIFREVMKDASKVKSGRAVVIGTETLIGSVATLLSSVQR